ncbi:MAG TPA: 3'-5' exonuclease [Candidatus Coatesbacteria bacterium]|nr:3'-5' exonuclease [Candidatus Coatesbacteria bacterium]
MRDDVDSFTAVDVETTGLDARLHRVVEIALVRFEAGREAGVWSSLVNPGCPIPPEATAVHGIGDRDVAGAPTFLELAPQVGTLLGGFPPLAYNAPFDYGFLAAEMARAGRPVPPLAAWLDPLPLVRARLSYGRATLETGCREFGVPLPRAHRAADDARAAGLLWLRLSRER